MGSVDTNVETNAMPTFESDMGFHENALAYYFTYCLDY